MIARGEDLGLPREAFEDAVVRNPQLILALHGLQVLAEQAQAVAIDGVQLVRPIEDHLGDSAPPLQQYLILCHLLYLPLCQPCLGARLGHAISSA